MLRGGAARDTELLDMGGKIHGGQESNMEDDSKPSVVSTHGNSSSGWGESRQMQPQAIYGVSVLQGLRGNPLEDFQVAEFRDIDGEEVGHILPYSFSLCA